MDKICVTIRKYDNKYNKSTHPSRKNLHKQILTLHRKIQKNDKILTEYSIEKDEDKRKYHIHLLIHYNDGQNLYNELSRFVGGTSWIKVERGLRTFDECDGRYGKIHLEPVMSEQQYREYINKFHSIKSLV